LDKKYEIIEYFKSEPTEIKLSFLTQMLALISESLKNICPDEEAN